MNAAYPMLKRLLGEAAVELEGDDLRVALVDTTAYTYDDAHETLADVPAGALVAASTTIAGRGLALDLAGDAVLDADDTTVYAVMGEQVGAIVVYGHTGDDGSSPLLWCLDQDADGVTPLAHTPTGGNVTIVWNDGPQRLLWIR